MQPVDPDYEQFLEWRQREREDDYDQYLRWRRQQRDDDGRKNDWIIVVGWVTAFLIPIVGFVLGTIMSARPDPDVGNNGWKIMAVSLVVAIAWGLIVVNEFHTATP
jgi:hypothetical protein